MAAPGHAFGPDTPWQRELEDAFPYVETVDQLQTINEVKADMESPVPMDQVICGDVGYGKTEIAIRAAFKAVMDGKQVAVLVPTTLLAQQHFATFSERFANFPLAVRMVSRFNSAAEQQAVLDGVCDGSVDVVIGTHRLLSAGTQFKDLGLVIVDEEQRFGVEHKEHLKALRTAVDVLTMSATPIPRTLEMAITGIREMSTIQTPPEERHPVLTFVGPYDDKQIGAAIRRELLREGQVFYIHNRVDSIDRAAARLRERVPEARVAIAHGQMNEDALEHIMMRFWEKEFDVLVCTTIVESGLDIANANTLVVERADTFGVSQLHQLRGRVGRGRERAYSYFLFPPEKPLTELAHDRLATIAANTDLGAGMAVAMKDLEIRGDVAGLLPAEQVAGAADLQVLHRHRHASAEVGVGCDGGQPVVRQLGQRLLRWEQEVGVRALPATTDPAAQLVQLADPEGVRPLHHQGVCVGDVQSALDDRRTDQDVELLPPEPHHDVLERVLVHLAVRDGHPRLRHPLAQPRRRSIDRVHPVVDVEDLALAQQLAADGGADLLVVVRPDEGQHRVPFLRRGLDGRHLPDAGDRHLQRPRNRRRRHGQHVHRRAQRLEVLLVLDPEALLLVDDDQAQVLELGSGREQPVSADHDVDAAVADPVQDRLLLGGAVEPADHPDGEWEVGEPLGERGEVLLREQRRRHEYGNLLAVHHRLERRPDGDLGLAVADVSADHPVHRDRRLHVGLDFVDGLQLVDRLDVREGVLELALPWGVRAEGVAGRGHPGAVEPDQLGGDLLDRFAGAAFALGPVRPAEPVQRGRLTADVAGDLVEGVGGDEEPVTGQVPLRGGVLQNEVLPGRAGDRALHHLDVAADPVLLVHD